MATIKYTVLECLGHLTHAFRLFKDNNQLLPSNLDDTRGSHQMSQDLSLVEQVQAILTELYPLIVGS
jgi:hypothetical protein